MQVKFIKLETPRLLEKCRLGDRRSQQLLYEQYAASMLGICRRYLPNLHEAEDALMLGFVKAFTQLDKLKDDDKFSAWIRRIMSNECLMILRKKKRMKLSDIDDIVEPAVSANIIESLSSRDILKLVEKLPLGYRTVFNMYVIEGYKHKEIAEILGLSVNTSKSQLIMARKRIKSMMKKMNAIRSSKINDQNQAN